MRIRRNLMILTSVFFVYTLAGGEFSGTAKIESISMELKTPEKLIFLLWMSFVYYSWRFKLAIGDNWSDFRVEAENMLISDEKFKGLFIKYASEFQPGFSNKEAAKNLSMDRWLLWYKFKHRSETGNGLKSQFQFAPKIYERDYWRILEIDMSNFSKIWSTKKYACDYYFPYLYIFIVALYMLLSRAVVI